MDNIHLRPKAKIKRGTDNYITFGFFSETILYQLFLPLTDMAIQTVQTVRTGTVHSWPWINEIEVAFERTRSGTEQCSEDALGEGKGQGYSYRSEGYRISFPFDCTRIPRIGFHRACRPAPLEEAISEAHLIVALNTSMISIEERIIMEN